MVQSVQYLLQLKFLCWRKLFMFFMLFLNYHLILGLNEEPFITPWFIMFHFPKLWHHFRFIVLDVKKIAFLHQVALFQACFLKQTLFGSSCNLPLLKDCTTGPKNVYVGEQFQALRFFQSGNMRLYHLACPSITFHFVQTVWTFFWMQPTICKPMLLCNTSDNATSSLTSGAQFFLCS